MRAQLRTIAARGLVAVGLAGAMLASLLVAPPTAGAHPGVPAALFDPPEVSWASVRNHNSAGFEQQLADYRSRGFLPLDIDIATDAGYRAGAVFQRNPDGRDWRVVRDLTDAAYHEQWSQARADGLRPVDQETYILDGTRRYAGVFLANPERYGWASYRGLTTERLHEVVAEQRRAGRMPIDIDSYLTGTTVRHLVVFVANPQGLDWDLTVGQTGVQFALAVVSNQRRYRMLGFDSLAQPAGQRYDAIWVENRDGRQWRVRLDLTSQQYANWWSRSRDEGYRVITSYRYETAGGTRYAMILRQNSDRPDWTLRAAVDARIQSELNTHSVPGISVAIMQDGEYRYLRGFGHADIASDVWLDTLHVQRLASISKSVTATMTMGLVEDGMIGPGNLTRAYVPQLPAHHTHTVGQLLSHRGCVRHYGQGNPTSIPLVSYPTATSAAQVFWGDPLVCTVGQYNYSTHGFTILGAALEAATGESATDLVVDRITGPYGLTTLRPEDRTDSSVRRVTLYTGANNVANPDDLSWKTLGGGMEASARDLARFGSMLAAGDIVSAQSRATMWTAAGSGSSYGYGWSTGTEAGRKVVAHDGSQLGARSYLRIYPDDGIVIAVLSNRQGGGHSAVQVGRDIGAMILADLDG